MARKEISVVVDAIVGNARRKLQSVSGELKKIQTTTRTTAAISKRSYDSWKQGLVNLENVMKATMAAGVVMYAKMMASSAMASARITARNMEIEKSFESLSMRYNLASTELVDALSKAAKGTVDKFSIMLAANKAMRLGVATTTEEFEQLMKIAMVRAKEFGFTTAQAFDFIVTAIGRASPMIADNIGILLDATTTYDEYARSIGKTADQLTMLEQKEAIRKRILREGTADLEVWSEAIDSAATKIERYDAAMTEFSQNIKEMSVGPLTDLLDKLATMPAILDQIGYAFGVSIAGMMGSWNKFADLLEQRDIGAILSGQTVEAGQAAMRAYARWDHIQKRTLSDIEAFRAKAGRMWKGFEDIITPPTPPEVDTSKAEDSWGDYYDTVAKENRSFNRRMEDMAFQQAQAQENADRRRFEIFRSNQRSIESAQTAFNLRQRTTLENLHVDLRRMRRDYLDDLVDLEWDYQNKVQDLQKRAPWWIRQALQKEFAERKRIAATGDKKALRQFDDALKERIRQIDPVYAEELDELQKHYEHQQEIEKREHGQSYRDKEGDYRRNLRQQQRALRQQLRDLRRNLDDQLDSWRFQQRQRHENEARAMERLRQEHAHQLAQMEKSLNEKLAEINKDYEHWGWTHGTSYATKFNEAMSRAGPQFTPYDPNIPFPEEWTGFQRGTPYVPSNMLALLHKGEMVVPAAPAERMREGGGGVTVSIENLHIGAGVGAANVKRLAEELGIELGRGIRQGYR